MFFAYHAVIIFYASGLMWSRLHPWRTYGPSLRRAT